VDWKKGRGALGIFRPLIGNWTSQPAGDEPPSRLICVRRFTPLWQSAYVRLDAHWTIAPGKSYEEVALFGKARDGALTFWSFTSDGKNAQGRLSDGSDVHPQAIAFEAEMPGGLARFVYWPEGAGFDFAVENRTKKGWNRFMRHHYLPTP
jgi:hypothetical protein